MAFTTLEAGPRSGTESVLSCTRACTLPFDSAQYTAVSSAAAVITRREPATTAALVATSNSSAVASASTGQSAALTPPEGEVMPAEATTQRPALQDAPGWLARHSSSPLHCS